MTGQKSAVSSGSGAGATHTLIRWECRCRIPPVLLATYDERGRIHIKARDRYWHVNGVVQTVCPRCGSEHTLDMGRVTGERG